MLNYKNTILILVDVWDNHWCKKYLKEIKPKIIAINKYANKLRNLGAIIVHAPSNCRNYYINNPNFINNKNLTKSRIKFKKNKNIFSIDKLNSKINIDTCNCDSNCNFKYNWNKINNNINILDSDYIIDNNLQNLYNIIVYHKIKNIIYCGFALNIYILNREIGIKNTIRLDLNIYINTDLVEIFCNLKKSKFKSKEEVKNYILNYYKYKGISLLKI